MTERQPYNEKCRLRNRILLPCTHDVTHAVQLSLFSLFLSLWEDREMKQLSKRWRHHWWARDEWVILLLIDFLVLHVGDANNVNKWDEYLMSLGPRVSEMVFAIWDVIKTNDWTVFIQYAVYAHLQVVYYALQHTFHLTLSQPWLCWVPLCWWAVPGSSSWKMHTSPESTYQACFSFEPIRYCTSGVQKIPTLWRSLGYHYWISINAYITMPSIYRSYFWYLNFTQYVQILLTVAL